MSTLSLQLDPAPDQARITPKQRQILAAAEELFLAHGYGAVSMDQIARQAAVSKATLYAYFPSKDSLFATIVGDKGHDSPLSEDLFPSDVTDLQAALEAVGQRTLRFMLQERTLAIYRIAMAESVRFPELGQAFYQNGPQRMIDRFCVWLTELGTAGLVDVDNHVVATQQFMALVRSGVFFRRSLALLPVASEAEIVDTARAASITWMKAYARDKCMISS